MRNHDLRPAAKANPTIQQAFERFQKYNRLKNLSQGSLDFYAAKGRSFFRFLGDTEQPITTITEETVEDYIFYMKDQQLHDTTINTNLRMVRAFLYWCMEKGYLEKYPIRLVRADDPIKEPYTTDELQKLLKEPDCKTCSFAEYRNWVIVNFLLGTGCRASTLLNLHIDPASLTEEERQQKLQEILDCIKASRKKKKEADEQLDPIVPEEEPETAGVTPQPAKQYITDLVGEDYKNWHGIVVLDAGTNSGKTYFILKTLLPWAYEHRKRILILCNREALRSQIERDVNRLGSIEVSYEDYDPALGGIVNKPAIDNKYEHTIRVETYQWLETFLQRNEDMKDRALKYIVSELWNPLVNAQILGRKRPLDEGDTCAVYLLHYPKERLEGELKKSRSISWNRSRHIENGLMIGRHGRHTCISLKQWKY